MMKTSTILGMGFSALFTSALLTGCIASEEVAPAEGDEATATESAALTPTTEVLALDVSDSASRGLFGKRYDYTYNVGGGTVTHQEFTRSTSGSADANLVSLDGNQAKVHAWADAYSGFNFTLRVWVQR